MKPAELVAKIFVLAERGHVDWADDIRLIEPNIGYVGRIQGLRLREDGAIWAIFSLAETSRLQCDLCTCSKEPFHMPLLCGKCLNDLVVEVPAVRARRDARRVAKGRRDVTIYPKNEEEEDDAR